MTLEMNSIFWCYNFIPCHLFNSYFLEKFEFFGFVGEIFNTFEWTDKFKSKFIHFFLICFQNTHPVCLSWKLNPLGIDVWTNNEQICPGFGNFRLIFAQEIRKINGWKFYTFWSIDLRILQTTFSAFPHEKLNDSTKFNFYQITEMEILD
jgi:hypothetical protein